tara:strand:+ start:1912 stop:2211 length:300 start_codon:yes stop_codon:yes gene_type:complete
MKALIFKNKVVDIVETAFEVSPSMSWADAPEGCQTGWLIVDGVISTPPELAVPYAAQRSQEYPPITDYIDGVVKGDQAQIDAYISACQAVKAKYPAPAE